MPNGRGKVPQSQALTRPTLICNSTVANNANALTGPLTNRIARIRSVPRSGSPLGRPRSGNPGLYRLRILSIRRPSLLVEERLHGASFLLWICCRLRRMRVWMRRSRGTFECCLLVSCARVATFSTIVLSQLCFDGEYYKQLEWFSLLSIWLNFWHFFIQR